MAGESGFLSLSLEITGQEVEAKFATWGTAITSLEEPLEQIGEDLLGDFAQNMVLEGGFFGGSKSYLGDAGGPWQPLAPSTVKERERLGYGGEHPMLWREGSLGHSLAERGAEGNIFEVGPTSLTVGSSLFYAAILHTGYVTENRTLPARPLVGLSWTRRSQILARINAYVMAQAAGAGLTSASGGPEEE